MHKIDGPENRYRVTFQKTPFFVKNHPFLLFIKRATISTYHAHISGFEIKNL